MDDARFLKHFLDDRVEQYNKTSFIADDPISIPHRFSKKQDIEIAGFFAAVFAWGNRRTIINKCNLLMELMDGSPYDFCLHHTNGDLKKMRGFVHRTFNEVDLFYFIKFLNLHYQQHASLETAFFNVHTLGKDAVIEIGLNYFFEYFFSLPQVPARTRKHLAAPKKKSACKRLNMFLRWMVRNDPSGVDFGIWKKIKPSALICPLDVHVARVARDLGLLKRKQNDWMAALELTEGLRAFNPDDPVRYDFALFGLGVNNNYESNFTFEKFY